MKNGTVLVTVAIPNWPRGRLRRRRMWAVTHLKVLNPGSRHVEGEGCQTACWSVRSHSNQPHTTSSSGCQTSVWSSQDAIEFRGSGIDPLVDRSHPPWEGTEPDVPFHGHQCGVLREPQMRSPQGAASVKRRTRDLFKHVMPVVCRAHCWIVRVVLN